MRARGLCGSCYNRARLSGDLPPKVVRGPRKPPGALWRKQHRAYLQGKTREWAAANPERVRSTQRAAYARNRTQLLERKRMEYAAEPEKYRARKNAAYDPVKGREGRIRKKLARHGMSLDEYEAMRLAQGDRCAICGTDDPGGGNVEWSLDHNHRTNKVRGLLCNRCNTAIGLLRDDPAIIAAASEYVRRA